MLRLDHIPQVRNFSMGDDVPPGPYQAMIDDKFVDVIPNTNGETMGAAMPGGSFERVVSSMSGINLSWCGVCGRCVTVPRHGGTADCQECKVAMGTASGIGVVEFSWDLTTQPAQRVYFGTQALQ